MVIEYRRTSSWTDKNNFQKCVIENKEKPQKIKLKGIFFVFVLNIHKALLLLLLFGVIEQLEFCFMNSTFNMHIPSSLFSPIL